MRTLKTLLALALLAPALALANGYTLPNTGARDLAMAGALVAAQRDAAAVFQNQAALSRLPEGFNLSASLAMLDLENTWTSPDGSASNSMLFRPVPPPALYAAWAGKAAGHGWGVGLGFNVVGGANVFWPETWPGRYRIVEVDRKVYGSYLAAGFEVIPQLRLGAALTYIRTAEKLRQAINFYGTDGWAEIGTAGGQFAYDVSLELQPVMSVPLVLGVNFKEEAKQKLKGKAHFSNVPDALANTLVDQGATHELTFPRKLHAGLSWRATKPLLVTLAYTYEWYEVYKDDTFKGDFATTCPSATCVVVPRNYGNGHTYRFGIEYQATERLELRAGLLRDLSGQDTDHYSPTLPDGNAWAGSAGASWHFDPTLAATVGLFYAKLDKVTATGQYAFQGSYTPSAFLVSAGVTWSAGPSK